MNLERFGLTRNDNDEVVPDGSTETVEISKREAERSSVGVEVIEVPVPQNPTSASSFSAASISGSSSGRKPSKKRRSRPSKKYVKRKKNTSKKFIAKMKKKFDLLDLKKPIREMSKSALLEHFKENERKAASRLRNKDRSDDGPYVDKKKFARNVIWQVYQEIRAGRPPEFAKVSCNIRSIYYYVKSAIRDQASVFEKPDGIYDNFTDAMQELVQAGLISYKDFNIVDDRRSYRLMPPAYGNTHVILLAEKDSFVGRFFQLGSQYGVMVQITKGRGSVLMVDTILTEMYEAGYDMSKQLNILSFCDFDPVGTSIPYHFAEHLKILGFKNIKNFSQYGELTMTRREGRKKKTVSQIRPCLDIVSPHDLERSVRNRLAHKLPASVRDNPSTADWAFITRGVTGTGKNKSLAISSEMLLPYVTAQLDEKIRPLLTKPPEVFGRKLNYSYLHRAIREYIGARVERGLLEGF